MIDGVLVLTVFSLGVAVALGFGRLIGLSRDNESLRLRVASVEMARAPQVLPSRTDVLPARPDLPPKGGNYRIEM